MPTTDELEERIAVLEQMMAALSMTATGSSLLLGNVTSDIKSTAARTDRAAADGEHHLYTSGSTIVFQIFDKDAGAWRSEAFA